MLAGAFALTRCLQVRFSITFLHAELDSLDMAAPSIALTVPAAGTISTQLATPSPNTVYARFCPGRHDLATGLFVGRVRDVDNAVPLQNAVVTVAWTDFVFDSGRAHTTPVHVDAVSNDAGVYVLCGLPQDLSLEMYATSDGFGAGPVPVTLDSLLIGRANMAISRRDAAARLVAAPLVNGSGKVLESRAGTAVVTGMVRNEGDRPVSGATAALHGTEVAVRTDDAGRFRLSGIPSGTRAIDVRSIGATPATFAVALRTGAVLDTAIRLDRVQRLRAVSVVERRASIDKTGFTERARRGIGRYLTREDIERLPTENVISLASRLGSLRFMKTYLVMRGGGHSTHDKTGRLSNPDHACLPAIFLDGQQIVLDPPIPDPYATLKSMAPVDDIMGIEVYTSGEPIPSWADRSTITGCGSIIIWTRFTLRQ